MVIVAALLLGGCAGSDSDLPLTAAPTTSAASPTTAAPESTTTTALVTTVATTPATSPPVTTPAPTAPPASDACATGILTITAGDSDGAAGSIFTPLVFTNNGTTACTLDGHPGVSFVDTAGNQIGPSADRTDVATPTVTLAPGEQAHATLQTHDAGFFDAAACAPVHAERLKIFPPDQTDAIIIAFPFDVCTGAIPEAQFTIDVVSPGTSA